MAGPTFRHQIAAALMSMMLHFSLEAKKRMIMPISRPISPTRLVRKALSAASELGLFFPPMADERKRADAHKLPTNNHLQHVRAGHEEQHGSGEQRQEGEVVGEAAITSDIVGAVDVHQHRHQVTTTSSVTVRPSTMVPTVKSIPPFDHQVRSEQPLLLQRVLPASASVKA